MLIITGYIDVAPEDVAGFLTEFDRLAIVTRQRDGNIAYDAAVSDFQAGRLIVAERWVSQAALSTHLDATDTVQFVKRWQGKMRGDVRKYDAFNGRDLMAV